MCAFLKIQDISVLSWSKDIWFYLSALQKIPLLFCFESRMSEQQILVSSHTLTLQMFKKSFWLLLKFSLKIYTLWPQIRMYLFLRE